MTPDDLLRECLKWLPISRAEQPGEWDKLDDLRRRIHDVIDETKLPRTGSPTGKTGEKE